MKELIRKIAAFQFVKFSGVGVILLIFGLVAFYLTLEVLALPLYPTYITIYIIAVFLSYYLNSKYTFNSKIEVNKGIKYYVVYIAGLTFGLALLFILEQYINVSNFFLVYIVFIPRTIFTFLLSKFFVFRTESV